MQTYFFFFSSGLVVACRFINIPFRVPPSTTDIPVTCPSPPDPDKDSFWHLHSLILSTSADTRLVTSSRPPVYLQLTLCLTPFSYRKRIPSLWSPCLSVGLSGARSELSAVLWHIIDFKHTCRHANKHSGEHLKGNIILPLLPLAPGVLTSVCDILLLRKVDLSLTHLLQRVVRIFHPVRPTFLFSSSLSIRIVCSSMKEQKKSEKEQ